jgi:hypothetical protein
MARHYRCEGNETAVGLMNLTASTAAELSGPPPSRGVVTRISDLPPSRFAQ